MNKGVDSHISLPLIFSVLLTGGIPDPGSKILVVLATIRAMCYKTIKVLLASDMPFELSNKKDGNTGYCC